MPESVAVDLEVSQRFSALHRLIGNTPLLAIDFRYKGRPRVIYAKQESLNFTGSIKDRMALFIVEGAYRDGTLQPGMRIAEATSGNTGISFSAVGRALGHPVTIFMPDWMSAERTTARRGRRSGRSWRKAASRPTHSWPASARAAR